MRFIGATVSGHFEKRIGIEQFRFAIEVKKRGNVIKHFIRASVFYLAVKCDTAAVNDDYYFVVAFDTVYLHHPLHFHHHLLLNYCCNCCYNSAADDCRCNCYTFRVAAADLAFDCSTGSCFGCRADSCNCCRCI